jgi:hypothetical protein
MKQPKNFSKIEHGHYESHYGVPFVINYTESSSYTPKGCSVVWLSSTKYNKILAFVFSWDPKTDGCMVEMRFCEKGSGFKEVTLMKTFMRKETFESPETLRDHLSWLAVSNAAYL